MACEECARLVEECRQVEMLVASTLRDLRSMIGTVSGQEYARLKAAVDHARFDSETARLRLTQHQRSHTRTSVATG